MTSYAVPPQSLFLCKPYSIRRKLASTSTVRRQTYCAVKRPEPRIQGFFEETTALSIGAPTVTSSLFSLEDSKSPAIFVGITPNLVDTSVEEPFDVVIVHKDGLVRRLAPDLQAQRWSIRHDEITRLSSSYEVSSSFLVEFDDAKMALFKRRQDLVALALGDVVGTGIEKLSVLVLVSHPVGSERILLSDVKVQVFCIPPLLRSHGFGLEESQRLRHLLTVNLPSLEGQELESANMHWHFHAHSAGLNLSYDRGFVNVDLSQYSPSITSQFILPNEDFSSILRISTHSILGAGKSIIALYDTQHQSVQRSIAIHNLLSSSSKDHDHNSRTVFISYFAKLGIALAIKGNALLAFDLRLLLAFQSSSIKRKRDGLLIDAIGRGIGPSVSLWDLPTGEHREKHMRSLGLKDQDAVDGWNTLRRHLENHSESKDADAFDSSLKSHFHSIGGNRFPPSPEDYVNPEQILFILSKLFSTAEEQDHDPRILSTRLSTRLSILFWPKDTCEWLIKSGHLSPINVDISLRRSAMPGILPAFPAGSLVRAMADFDPSLKNLILLLKSPTSLDSDELTHTLRLFLDIAMARSASLDEPVAKTIVRSFHLDTDQRGGLDEISGHQASSSQAENSLCDVFVGLNLTLMKLHTQPSSTVATSFHSILSNTEMLCIVHHLRVSLAIGGYTTRFTEDPPIPIDAIKAAPLLSLDAITGLLNACIDAIGPSGWISVAGFTDTAADEQNVIAHMKSEISAALAGAEEAVYLKGILREFIRYAGTVVSTTSAGSSYNKTSGLHMKHEKLNGAELVVFTPASQEDGYGDSSGKMLPLSLKAIGDLSDSGQGTEIRRTKVKTSTGEVKIRSSREIGYLKRKAVGKYSFERLVV